MMSKRLMVAFFLLGSTLLLAGCSLSSLFGTSETPLIVVSPAPENPSTTSPPADDSTFESTPPGEVPGPAEEGAPAARTFTEETPPTEIATSTGLLKVPTPTPALTPTPTPERPKLEIKSSTIKLTEDGKKYLIEGQLYNLGRQTVDLTDFKIVTRLYDSRGALLTSTTGRPTLTSLSPQAASPFHLSVDYLPGVATYKLQGGY